MKLILKAALALVIAAGTPAALNTLLRPAGPPVPAPSTAPTAALLPILPAAEAGADEPAAEVVLFVNGRRITDPARKAALLAAADEDVSSLLETDALPDAAPAPGQRPCSRNLRRPVAPSNSSESDL